MPLRAYAVRFELTSGAPGKLPLANGLLEAAEESGLLWVVRFRSRVHALPPGTLWGQFREVREALKAFEAATAAATEMLGFLVRPERVLASELNVERPPLGGPGRPVERAFSDADPFTTCLMHQLCAAPERPAWARRRAGASGRS